MSICLSVCIYVCLCVCQDWGAEESICLSVWLFFCKSVCLYVCQDRGAEESKCLGVFGLSLNTDERELRDVFSHYGPIEDVRMVLDYHTQKSRGFAFIYMKHLEDAVEVMLRFCSPPPLYILPSSMSCPLLYIFSPPLCPAPSIYHLHISLCWLVGYRPRSTPLVQT